MIRVTLRNITGRIATLVLTALAVVLGTAFVAGSLVFTDSIDRTFSQLFSSTSVGTDVVVRGAEGAGSTGFGDGRVPVPLTVADDIAEVEGVAAVTPQIQGLALMVGADGTAVRNGQAPGLGLAFNPDDTNASLVAGRAPTGPDEIAPESMTLERSGLAIGDATKVVNGGEPVDVTIVGEVEQSSPSIGATFIYFDRDTAVAAFAPDGAVAGLDVRGDGSRSRVELVDEIAAVLPDGTEAITQDVVTEENEAALGTALGFVNTFLLVVAGVSLLVGVFIIFNVFSMLLARRTRELALLRAVGASGSQVLGSVLVEAVVVGLIGSVLGLGVGVGIAAVLQVAVGTLGFEISGGLPVDATTVIVTVVVGVVATVVSAMLPAVRASRVAPVTALRDDVALPEPQVRIQAAIGAVLALAGTSALLIGLFRDVSEPLYFVGAGVLATFIGVAVASPALARPVVWLVSLPSVALWGAVGRLARQNALRNPRRTAVTASSLMIGIALVGAVSIAASSINASLAETIENDLDAEYVLSSGQTGFFPTTVSDEVAALDDVDTVVPVRAVVLALGPAPGDAATAEPDAIFALAGSAEDYARAIELTVLEGDIAAVQDDGIAVTRGTAEGNDWTVGTVIEAQPGVASQQSFTVQMIYEDSAILDTSGAQAIVDGAVYEVATPVGEQGDNQVFVVAAEGADLAALRTELSDIVRPYVVVSVLDGAEFTSQATNAVTQILGIISALLALSIIVALLGIVITLVLSVVERRREIGLLRAVGLTRTQLRRVVTLEGVATSVFGALLGITLGVVFGLSLQRALSEQGLDTLSVPYLTLAVFVVVGALAGVLASAAPAWWASRRDILASIATE